MRQHGIARGLAVVVGAGLLAAGALAGRGDASGSTCLDPGFWRAAPPWSGDPGFWVGVPGISSPEAIDPGFWPPRVDPPAGRDAIASPAATTGCGPPEGWAALPSAVVSFDGEGGITTVLGREPGHTVTPRR